MRLPIVGVVGSSSNEHEERAAARAQALAQAVSGYKEAQASITPSLDR
jgi:hypothetical protein